MSQPANTPFCDRLAVLEARFAMSCDNSIPKTFTSVYNAQVSIVGASPANPCVLAVEALAADGEWVQNGDGVRAFRDATSDGVAATTL